MLDPPRHWLPPVLAGLGRLWTAKPVQAKHATSIFPARDNTLPLRAADSHSAAIAAARDLPDGTPCDARLLAALAAEISARRTAAGMGEGPPSPRATKLCVRRSGVPDWWEPNGNLLLCAPDVPQLQLNIGFLQARITDTIVVIGTNVVPPNLNFEGSRSLVVLGDGVVLLCSAATAGVDSTILIGEHTTATWMAMIDARNGGMLVVGDDNMWAAGVSFLTDDTHAIRDQATGKRINRFGGRIMLGRHVWLGEQTRVMGDCLVRHDAVVGAGSFVKNITLPPHSVSVGRPARPVKSGVVWSRDDLP